MQPWQRRSLQSVFLPGGLIVFGAFVLLNYSRWAFPEYGVQFFYYAALIAALLLSWRFHAIRILLCAIVLLLAQRALSFFAQPSNATPAGAHIAFGAVAVLLPLNFIVLSFFPERGSRGNSLFWFLALLFFESVFVAAIARPGQAQPAFLHFRPFPSFHSHLPQSALLVFLIALCFLLLQLIRLQKPTIIGMFWSLVAAGLALNAGGPGKVSSAYFGAAALVLAGSIVENSYFLAYRDELTGLQSRRAFNEAVLRLKPPYAVAAVDIDHFKNINDTYGHDVGDQVLRMVSSKLARVGADGEPFRVGGEEFTILFPGKTGAEVVDYLELLRLEIESSTFRVRSGEERRKAERSPQPPERRYERKKRSAPPKFVGPEATLSVTVSIGIGESQPKLSSDEIITRADAALYRAKRGGRNRIETGVPRRGILGFGRKKPNKI